MEFLRRGVDRLESFVHSPIRLKLLLYGAGSVILAGLLVAFDDVIYTYLVRPVLRGAQEAAALPAGYLGLGILAVFVLLLTVAFFDSSPTVAMLKTWLADRGERSARAVAPGISAQALETERAAAREAQVQLCRLRDAMTFGPTCLFRAETLSTSDQEYLAAEMETLLPFIYEAGECVKNVTTTLLHDMWSTGESDARHWLAHAIYDQHIRESARVYERLAEGVRARADTREALASFHAHYVKTLEWLERMREFMAKPFASVEGFGKWQVHHEQYKSELQKRLAIRQFEAVRHCIVINKQVLR